jgi:hypothetical protein
MNSDFDNYFPEDPPAVPLRNTVVDFYNESDSDIPEFSAVALTGAFGETSWQLSRRSGEAIFTARPAADDSLPWGIALGAVPCKAFGRAVVSGTAPANFTGTGKYVSPGAAGLTAGNTGAAAVMLQPLPVNGSSTLPGLILLGSTAAVPDSPEEYHGIFKMVALSATSVQIINGRNIASAYCGATDVPGLGSLPVTEIELDDVNEWQIFLAFFYDGKNYSARFVTALPENTVFSQLIGRFRCGSVEQIYQSDDSRMVFKDEWYL